MGTFVRGAELSECECQVQTDPLESVKTNLLPSKQPDMSPSMQPNLLPLKHTSTSSSLETKYTTENRTRTSLAHQRFNSCSENLFEISDLCDDLQKLDFEKRVMLKEYQQQ